MDEVLAAVRRSAALVADYADADDESLDVVAEEIGDAIAALVDGEQLEGLVGLLDLPVDRMTRPLLDEVAAALVAAGPAAVEPLLCVAAGQPLVEGDMYWRGWERAIAAAGDVLSSMDERDQVLGLMEVLSGEADHPVKSLAAELLAAIGAPAVDDLEGAVDDPVAGPWARRALTAARESLAQGVAAPDADGHGEEAIGGAEADVDPVDVADTVVAEGEYDDGSAADDDGLDVDPEPGPVTDPEVARLLEVLSLPQSRAAQDSFYRLADELAGGGPETVARLLEVKARGDTDVDQRVGVVFDRMETDAFFADLLSVLLTDADPVRRRAALRELETMGPAAVDRLEALRDDDGLGPLAALCLDAVAPVVATPVECDEYDAVRVAADGLDPAAVLGTADAYFEAETDDDAQYAIDELGAAAQACGDRMDPGLRDAFRSVVDRLLDVYFAEENDGDAAWAVDSLTALVDACGPVVAAIVIEETDDLSGLADLETVRARAADVARVDPGTDDGSGRRAAVIARIVAGEGMRSG